MNSTPSKVLPLPTEPLTRITLWRGTPPKSRSSKPRIPKRTRLSCVPASAINVFPFELGVDRPAGVGGLTIRRRLTACPTDLADSVRFAKSLAVGTTGDAEVSTKRLIRSRLRYGQSGRATRRRYLAGGKQRIRPPNLVTQRHLHKSAA